MDPKSKEEAAPHGAKMKNAEAARETELDFLSHLYALESNWASRVTLQSSYVNTHTHPHPEEKIYGFLSSRVSKIK